MNIFMLTLLLVLHITNWMLVCCFQTGGWAVEARKRSGSGTLRVSDHLLQRHLRLHSHVVRKLANAGRRRLSNVVLRRHWPICMC